MATSDPPVRGMAATGSPEAFTMIVNGKPTRVPTEDKDLEITVTSGRAKFTLPLDKKRWSLEIKRIP